MTAIERVNVSPQTIKSREDVGRSGEARSTADSSTTKAKAEERVKLDGIILECSGLDELAPVLQVWCLRCGEIIDPCSFGEYFERFRPNHLGLHGQRLRVVWIVTVCVFATLASILGMLLCVADVFC